ncbi:fasciclin domain-containing protein [Mucilaginibacter sp. RB4R14]|uniref:fasciclin domain-containing protein n=1 Tax=Mucilaginibacter aurantiaciroseus TaxID=2949308 RepID=UPI002090CF54|nr:fasciclin domain-containing protein [Mucilaginibacter aurantiaciroseus]MCO5937436.1 fasciclin domain-containing protein [Mucilaginibacter aurantiaciroseus]
MENIVEIASGNKDFSTLVAAVVAAGLAETLSGNGPFTVFAPTNEAFAKLPAGTVEELLKPENKEKLASILTYHVVAGKVMSKDLSNGQKAKTVNGQEITVAIGDGVKIENATVTTADLEASNGVIHVIDSVILPK